MVGGAESVAVLAGAPEWSGAGRRWPLSNRIRQARRFKRLSSFPSSSCSVDRHCERQVATALNTAAVCCLIAMKATFLSCGGHKHYNAKQEAKFTSDLLFLPLFLRTYRHTHHCSKSNSVTSTLKSFLTNCNQQWKRGLQFQG